MGKLKLAELTPKMKAFALEYCLSGNGAEAAVLAGYAKKGAAVRAHKLLNHPGVSALVEQLNRKSREEFEIHRQEVLLRLWMLVTRDPRKYLTEDAVLDAIHLKHGLEDREAAAIDGIKQKVLKRYEDDGVKVEILQTEVKLSPIAPAIEMAMRHKGLFELDNAQQKEALTIDFDQLLRDQRHTIDVNPIEERLKIEEKE
jgi:phage terminase small subunit